VVEDINVESAWPHEMLSEERFGNRFVRFNFSDSVMSGTPGTAEAKISLRIKRQARADLTQKKETGKFAQEDLERFLLPSKFVSVEGAVAREAERIVGDEANSLVRARLLYNHIVNTVVYDKSGEGWGRGDSQFACNTRTGNCTDFHSLFMGEARHLGIPARFIMGFGLPDERGEGVIAGYHCWAEFYVDDYGWIPIDASEAHKNPDKRDLLFGGLDTSRIQFTKGRDIRLPKAQGEPVNFSIYPYVEVDGRPHPHVEFTFAFKDVE
jgi:transglutaminase-like putative cysteine protease